MNFSRADQVTGFCKDDKILLQGEYPCHESKNYLFCKIPVSN